MDSWVIHEPLDAVPAATRCNHHPFQCHLERNMPISLILALRPEVLLLLLTRRLVATRQTAKTAMLPLHTGRYATAPQFSQTSFFQELLPIAARVGKACLVLIDVIVPCPVERHGAAYIIVLGASRAVAQPPWTS